MGLAAALIAVFVIGIVVLSLAFAAIAYWYGRDSGYCQGKRDGVAIAEKVFYENVDLVIYRQQSPGWDETPSEGAA